LSARTCMDHTSRSESARNVRAGAKRLLAIHRGTIKPRGRSCVESAEVLHYAFRFVSLVSAGQAGLDERLHALRRIVARQVDERGDLVGFQVLNGKRNEELTKVSLAGRRIEPPIARSRR
jgi:hypothetical protein